jgi:hypothetical protein
MTYKLAFFVTLAFALAGCDRAKTKQAQTQPNKPASFRNTIFESVTPTVDGGAYAISSARAPKHYYAQPDSVGELRTAVSVERAEREAPVCFPTNENVLTLL